MSLTHITTVDYNVTKAVKMFQESTREGIKCHKFGRFKLFVGKTNLRENQIEKRRQYAAIYCRRRERERKLYKELLMGFSGHCRRRLTSMHTHRKSRTIFYHTKRERKTSLSVTSGSIFVVFSDAPRVGNQKGRELSHTRKRCD